MQFSGIIYNSFFLIFSVHRTERDHKAAVMFQKVKVLPFPPNSPEMEFSKRLASYASQFVLQEFKLMDKSMKTMKSFKVQTSEGQKKSAYWMGVYLSQINVSSVAICLHCEKYCNTHFLKQIYVIKDGHLLITEQHRGFFPFHLPNLSWCPQYHDRKLKSA